MSYDEVVQCYDKAVDLSSNFKRKGKTMPYTSANGHMFSIVNKEGQLGVRLSKEDEVAFIEKHKSLPFISHGATMKNYVLIPDEILLDTTLLASYIEKGFSYAMSLKKK